VPAYPEGEKRRRNGYRIDRLKDKLGTRELATAEVTFEGARALPVGEPSRSLANLVRHVLVPSRFACVISAAGFLRRAERIAAAYTDFRTAFGRSIGEYPLVRKPLERIRRARRRSLAAVFALLARWESDAPEASADFRILLSLCKPVLTRRSTERLHEAMMLLGGNGIEERFSPLPRLYRVAVIMETWEGPHNVLLTQALRDLGRLDLDPRAFVERSAGTTPASEDGSGPARLADRLEELLEAGNDPETTVAFARWAEGMVRAFADHALREAGAR
jgi:alkylation response protein AidB-like acyl-CoA dehydrogenase